MKFLCCVLATGGLVSCAQMNSMKTAAVEKWHNLPLPGRSRIPIVEPRQGEMRDFKTGHDQAVAFQKTRSRRFFGIFSGPVDFKEPQLPADSSTMDGGLLPPKVD